MSNNNGVPAPFWGNITNYALIVGGLVHDMSNTLLTMSGYLELANEAHSGRISISEEGMKRALQYAEQAVQHASTLLKFLRNLSGQFYKTDSEDILFTNPTKTIDKLKTTNPWHRSDFRWVIRGAKKIPVISLPEPIFILIISELISNSFRSSKDSNHLVTLTITLSYFPEQSLLRINSKDTGIGYPDELIVKRSFIEDKTGLYILSEIADSLGGWLLIANDPKGGARTDIAITIRR